jgi:methionyl-tRNA formyltransferase
MPNKISFVYFGSSKISEYVLDELRKRGFDPVLNITSAREPLPELPDADLFVVASFGKILPAEVIYKPKFKTLNVHPSLLPKLRGPAPIQGAILGEESTGVTIMRMDEKMDHGPIVTQKEISISPWPDAYEVVEEKLGRAGGELLAEVIPKWVSGELDEVEQVHAEATFTKLIKKEDADISNDTPEAALRKVYAYHAWPRARLGDLIVTDAHIEEGKLVLDKVIPPGRKEMSYDSYLNGLKGKQ